MARPVPPRVRIEVEHRDLRQVSSCVEDLAHLSRTRQNAVRFEPYEDLHIGRSDSIRPVEVSDPARSELVELGRFKDGLVRPAPSAQVDALDAPDVVDRRFPHSVFHHRKYRRRLGMTSARCTLAWLGRRSSSCRNGNAPRLEGRVASDFGRSTPASVPNRHKVMGPSARDLSRGEDDLRRPLGLEIRNVDFQ